MNSASDRLTTAGVGFNLIVAWGRMLRSLTPPEPFFVAEQEEEMAILGPDPWPYSIEKNRVALETLLGYAVEQGLTDRRLDIGEIFAPTTLD